MNELLVKLKYDNKLYFVYKKTNLHLKFNNKIIDDKS